MQRGCCTCIVVFLFLVFLCGATVHADRGMIPVDPEVSVYEPGQKAILAWNGKEEILILSTDVSSSRQTLVVEILPLPSKPTVAAGSFHSFEEIQTLIWTEGLNTLTYRNKDQVRSGSVEVVFHEEIGAHNVTVVSASDASELTRWMNTFLEYSGVDESVSLGGFESAVEDYMTRGFRYYVLDVITLASEARSVDPILYSFTSDSLYYPLVITSPLGGDTEITLFVLTEDKIGDDYLPFHQATYRVADGSGQPIEFVLSKGELSQIDRRIGELLEDKAWLTVLRYQGDVGSLTEDLMITGYTSTDTPIDVNVAIPPLIIGLATLLGAASALLIVVLTLLITRSKSRTELRAEERESRS